MNHLQITPEHKSELFIIAIGASAGGMEAIHTLFDNTPTDEVSYVIIQHLSPDYKSFMAELLAKHSKLKIFKAEPEMEVVSNSIYIMPEGKDMTISGGKLFLKDRKRLTVNSAIDIFFNSLAEDLGDKSIGIVLSGNGSDGTKGIGAIKKVGGMVIVQDPQSAEFKSMPTNAIESGNYDYILYPDQIPERIAHYVKQKSLAFQFSETISDKDETSLKELINLIKSNTPLDFSEYKRPTIIRRLIRRMTATKTNTIESYIKVVKSNPDELDVLTKEFLIKVTSFFRDPEAFEAIRTKVIPEIIKNKLLVDTLKIWVIGCASGEEAYSLAILIKEYLIDIKKDIEVKIFASDIDKEALAVASKGHYTDKIIRDVSEERLDNFFIKEGNGYQVRENIRKMLIFADHDIVQQPPYGKIDLISCRNLLIYFNPTLQKKIFSTIHFCLNLDGFLFLGSSEGISDLTDRFREIDKKSKIYQKLEGSFKLGLNQYSPRQVNLKQKTSRSLLSKFSKSQFPDQLSEIFIQSHLEESGYLAGACVDEQNKVILPFGEFDKYFLPKLFNDDLLELLPAELAIAVGTTIKKAINEQIKVNLKQIKFRTENEVRSVKILVKPFLQEKKSPQQVIIVYFGEENIGRSSDEVIEVYDKDYHANRFLSEIEKELGETKQKLQDAYLALDESRDNIQSYNEELHSSNEELQSSNEELQSTNEELNTLNSQYQAKNKELAELNDDLNNFFRSTINSQLYVDEDLTIKKFTPVSMKQLNIKESDIGRPLTDISTNIKFTNFVENIKNVIATQNTLDQNVETTDGNWYNMVIMPYLRFKETRSSGAIITFNDFTDLIKSKKEIEIANDKLLRLNHDHNTFIYSVSHDLIAPLNNVQGFINIIQESDDMEEIKEFTKSLNKSVTQLRGIINELSEIARKEQEPLDFEKINFEELLNEVEWSLRGTLLQTKAKLKSEFEEKEIKYPKKYMRSILLNLLSNALKYSSPDRENVVEIKSQKLNGFVVLSVKDKGLGIAENKIGQLFSKFNRVHNLNSNVEGTGIGLYLVKQMVTNTGGEIKVESKIGEGSCFKVYFKELD